MCCLNVVGMIVPPGSAHASGLFVLGDDLAVIVELLLTDCALPVLLKNFLIQQLSHFPRAPPFPVASGMVDIFDPPQSRGNKHPFCRELLVSRAR